MHIRIGVTSARIISQHHRAWKDEIARTLAHFTVFIHAIHSDPRWAPQFHASMLEWGRNTPRER